VGFYFKLKESAIDIIEKEPNKKLISASDYKITTNIVTKDDLVTVSGRIGSGPKCRNLKLKIYARSNTGGIVNIVDTVDFSRGFGNSIFEGSDTSSKAKDANWFISNIFVTCRD